MAFDPENLALIGYSGAGGDATRVWLYRCDTAGTDDKASMDAANYFVDSGTTIAASLNVGDVIIGVAHDGADGIIGVVNSAGTLLPVTAT